jgi:hypothetical protein
MDIGAYKFLPDLLLRTPYYSFQKYDLERLPDLLLENAFRNALWLASPVFYRSLEKAEFRYAQLSPRQKHTLAKYYNRMCFRPVPFGSFAAVSSLQWGDGGTVRLAPESAAALQLVQDGDFANNKSGVAVADRMLCLNPLLYRLGKEYRLVHSLPDDAGTYRYEMRSFPAERFYRRLFRLFKKGPVQEGTLLTWLCEATGDCGEAAAGFLAFLLEQQVVFREDRGNVLLGTGQTPGLRTVSPGNGHYYAALLRPVLEGGPARALQTELLAAVRVLSALIPAESLPALDDYKRAFRRRYDERRVSLLEALDPDAGIAYGSDLQEAGDNGLKEADFMPHTDPKTRLNWTGAHQLLLKGWPREAGNCLHLSEEQVQAAGLVSDSGKLPPVLTLMFRQAGDLIVLDSAGGVSGLPLVGRF